MLSKLTNLFRRKPAAAQSAKRNRPVNFFDGKFRGMQAAASGGFQGGKLDRITEEWRPGTVGPNRMVQTDGQLLRERAWDLYINNPFASAVIDAIVANVIECGIMPERGSDWESAYRRWAGLTPHATRECDLSRDSTINELQVLWLTEMIVGGGCLVHYVTVPRRSQSVPMAIELIGEDRFATHLDHYGNNPKTANPVANGIEYDRATGRTLAWHVRKEQPNDLNFDPMATTRIRAENGEYGYFKWRTNAKRGTSLLRACIQWLWALGYYTDNELKNSSLKSCWAYMVKTGDDVDAAFPDVLDSSPETGTVDIYGNLIEKLEPQQIFRGFPGDDIEAVGPNVPQSESLPWILLIQRSIAIGARVSYEEAYRDYTRGSWSSVRSAMASDRKRFRPMQQFSISHFGNPTVRRFDDAAVGSFHPAFPSPSAWIEQRDEIYEAQEWSTPGWESPNPKDDAMADDIRLANGSTTHQQIQARQGRNWRKHFAQREAEQSTPGYPEPQPSAAMNQTTVEVEDK